MSAREEMEELRAEQRARDIDRRNRENCRTEASGVLFRVTRFTGDEDYAALMTRAELKTLDAAAENLRQVIERLGL